MIRVNLCVAVLCMAAVSACGEREPADSSSAGRFVIEDEAAADEIAELKTSIATVAGRVDALEIGQRYATISTTDQYSDVMTSQYGTFTVAPQGISPYLDGYKVKLRVGNLTAATFQRPTLKVYYGVDSMKMKEVPIMPDLKSGWFTVTEVVLSPAKAEEVKTLMVGIETDSYSLRMK